MKFKEIAEKGAQELEQLETKLRKELADLRMQAGSGQLAQASKIGLVRRDIARLLTAKKMKKAAL